MNVMTNWSLAMLHGGGGGASVLPVRMKLSGRSGCNFIIWFVGKILLLVIMAELERAFVAFKSSLGCS